MRMSMQSMGYKVFPVISSCIELIVKIAASFYLVPRYGYIAVAVTEPVTWVLCAAFLVIAYSFTYKKKLFLTTSDKVAICKKYNYVQEVSYEEEF